MHQFAKFFTRTHEIFAAVLSNKRQCVVAYVFVKPSYNNLNGVHTLQAISMHCTYAKVFDYTHKIFAIIAIPCYAPFNESTQLKIP